MASGERLVASPPRTDGVDDHWQPAGGGGTDCPVGEPPRWDTGGDGGLGSTLVVTRINSDPARAFFEDKFVEEGYVHKAPRALPPTPFDSARRGLWAIAVAPAVLLAATVLCMQLLYCSAA